MVLYNDKLHLYYLRKLWKQIDFNTFCAFQNFKNLHVLHGEILIHGRILSKHIKAVTTGPPVQRHSFHADWAVNLVLTMVIISKVYIMTDRYNANAWSFSPQ